MSYRCKLGRSRKAGPILGLAALAALGLAAAGPTHAQGPTSSLYLTDGDHNKNFIIQGNTVTQTSQSGADPIGGEYAIAVSGDVRTLGNGNPGDHGQGAGYNTVFTDTGTRYTYPASVGNFYDGTTDGTRNFSVDFNTGNVYGMDRNWQGPSLLFTAIPNDLGITYDRTNNSLWLSKFGGGPITDYSLTGAVLSGFTGVGGGALALDPADNTLWTVTQGSETFSQYTKTGTLLQTKNYALPTGENILGGEFNIVTAASPVPEPSSVAAFVFVALGISGLMFRARKRLA
jgi:hypothetical protein